MPSGDVPVHQQPNLTILACVSVGGATESTNRTEMVAFSLCLPHEDTTSVTELWVKPTRTERMNSLAPLQFNMPVVWESTPTKSIHWERTLSRAHSMVVVFSLPWVSHTLWGEWTCFPLQAPSVRSRLERSSKLYEDNAPRESTNSLSPLLSCCVLVSCVCVYVFLSCLSSLTEMLQKKY